MAIVLILSKQETCEIDAYFLTEHSQVSREYAVISISEPVFSYQNLDDMEAVFFGGLLK